MTGPEDLGRIQINEEVIATIGALAALEVDGIVSVSGVTSQSRLWQKPPKKGITVTTDENNHDAVIDLDIVVEYGVDVYKTAHHVQRSVKHAIEGMTGMRVKAVNVKIDGIKQSDRTPGSDPDLLSEHDEEEG